MTFSAGQGPWDTRSETGELVKLEVSPPVVRAVHGGRLHHRVNREGRRTDGAGPAGSRAYRASGQQAHQRRCETDGLADDHGPQGHRQSLHSHRVRVLPAGRSAGHAHARGAGPAGTADRQRGTVQPAVHCPRHHHDAVVRHADVRRLRERHHAASDRRTRRRLPAPQRAHLLALPLRRNHRGVRIRGARRRCPLRLVRLRTAEQCRLLARQPAETSGLWASCCRGSVRPWHRSISSLRSSVCVRRV